MNTKHPQLLAWLKAATDECVAKTGTTRAYLRLIGYGQKKPSPLMSVGIEEATEGAITRQQLRPGDWQSLWPELRQAPPTMTQTIPATSHQHSSPEVAGVLSSTGGAQ